MPDSVMMNGLKTLSGPLRKHYEKKVIILINEYDEPLTKAYEQGFYDEMIFLIRNIFERLSRSGHSGICMHDGIISYGTISCPNDSTTCQSGLYIPQAFFNNILISSLFPLKKLIFVGVFPFFGYALVTGISQALYPSCVALTER